MAWLSRRFWWITYLITFSMINFRSSSIVSSAGHMEMTTVSTLRAIVVSPSLLCSNMTQIESLMLQFFPFALLYADTSDCLPSSIPHLLTGLLYFYDLISLTRSHLAASCPVRYDLPCTIRIYEPPIRLLVVLVKSRFPST